MQHLAPVLGTSVNNLLNERMTSDLQTAVHSIVIFIIPKQVRAILLYKFKKNIKVNQK